MAGFIYNAIRDTDNGSVEGSLAEQIQKMRAAFAVFEYNTDRTILKRIAVWLRYLEIEYDKLSLQDHFLYRPADLMELLIRFYLVTGMKSVLRLCARVRATAFDWTTALHTFQQSIPVTEDTDGFPDSLPAKPQEMDYCQKEKLINYAELLADGMRYTLYAGMFSGNKQDLSSGNNLWQYLKKHHHALCGGTTSNPFLCGSQADQPVDNAALAAWTEAFSSQMILPDSEWALDEMIRIVFNGLDDCLQCDVVPERQYLNTVSERNVPVNNPEKIYARMTRAAAAAYKHAVSLTEDGIRINYLIPARYLLMVQKQNMILHMDSFSAHIQCKKKIYTYADFYIPSIGSYSVMVIRNREQNECTPHHHSTDTGCYIRVKGEWKDQDGFVIKESGKTFCEQTHHQGVCFYAGNRLLSAEASPGEYAYTVCEMPEKTDGRFIVQTSITEQWRQKDGQPGDIPVLPEKKGPVSGTELHYYHMTKNRITMFPRVNNLCFK
ncbi:hypothetical protein [Aristaeella lactis]|uniref:hypothetical protein n=1 Tax=Aristaeella lactis TaxID=3046383 RepID=UPI00118074EF|nr:hypothetical protein [Aristaeella lactis]QUA53739.1 hypothetical protein JYE50_03660 [Aristaeella lactis]